ncbi:hypothetical protein [Rhodococcus sp. RDE2]|uniref:hypothetical protein n=1 Tax=Rhodococcus sp. RDE2 TaxID=2885078 RepID=UPI001E5AE4D4|nr:hypothetical protein [Rhodococcus sp. RDE2]BDB63514.1 hypothetical protein RDE2_53080 [Rhodococcus sp. RDE2]
MKVSLAPWTLRTPTSRYAIRVRAAATVAQLRTELVAVHATGRDVEDPAWESARDTARATTAQLFTATGRLPLIERRLVDKWYFATGHTFWYMTGDRGYAPLEARAAELIAALPDGLDRVAAVEVIEEITHRVEMSARQPATAPNRWANRWANRSPVADQAEVAWRMKCDRTTILASQIIGSSATNVAIRQYIPWLDETLEAMSTPMSTPDVVRLAEQWRERRRPYTSNPDWADLIITDPIPRRPASLWWRVTRGDRPTPQSAPDV